MAVTAKPNAATAMARSQGAPSPRIGLAPRSTNAWPEGVLGLVAAADVSGVVDVLD
jgi:hypothetical protein